MLTSSASQLVYGRIYTFYPAKWVFLFSILVFEIGSAVCGAAPSSVALIIGRAVAGLGTGGIAAGMVIITVLTVPLEQRPIFQGLNGAIFGIASVLGPYSAVYSRRKLHGAGAFTSISPSEAQRW